MQISCFSYEIDENVKTKTKFESEERTKWDIPTETFVYSLFF